MQPIAPRSRRQRSSLGQPKSGRHRSGDDRQIFSPARRWHSAVECLEDRRLLTVAQDLVALISPYQQSLNTGLAAAASLPLVGDQIQDLQAFNTILQDSLSSIESQTQSLSSGHYELAIPLPSISETFTFDLGLDAFLQVSTAGGVSAAINPTLNVGFDYQNGTVSLDAAHTGLDVGFNLSLPNFQATMSFNGLLYTHAVDAGTNFQGHLGFDFNAGGGVSPHFSGDAHIRLGLTMSFVDPALNAPYNPIFNTDFELDWGFDTQSNQLAAPHIALKSFSIDVDSFMHGFLGDIVTTVQKYTKPLQPFIDTFDTPVPIISAFDSSQTVGDLLLQGAGLTQEQQDRFALMIKVIKTVNTIDLSGSTGGAKLNFGDINVGVTNASLPSGFNIDTSQLSSVIDDIFNDGALEDVQKTLESVASYAGLTSTAGFKFQLLEDPQDVVGGILTGQTKTMFSYDTGREHFELAPSIGVGIKDLLGVFLSAGVVFDASLSMGYDTAGLNKFVQDPLHKPEDLLHGFYFDNSVDTSGPPIPNVPSPKKTGLYVQGFAELSASAIVTLSGGLYANVSVELASADNSSHVALDSMVQNLASNAKVFKLSGQVYAAASIELTLSDPVGPDITLFSYELAKDVLVDFDPPPPPTLSLPLVVIDATNQHTLLLDPSKMTGGLVTVQPFHDFTVTSGGTFVGDGIRVDYPGEIDLFIERKDDVNTNYYNLIGVNGAVPDGVSINIVDPFRMFKDEGAIDPTPAQTKPGIVLAGGKNAYYKYTEVADGSHATALLAGGYGSNTLTGGTIEFGNFIPADRIAQAKAHFGDISGYDAAGQGLIDSSIDAAVAPADPAGIIGATMTASHGGLMLGGPGNNSFIATGAGAYEMIGGGWVNSFNITPSFAGGTATYQIDGGPYGQSSLIVRVPAGETADFENGTVPDKYHPEFKALDVFSNAGLFATAHGIQKVLATGVAGSTIVFGDTSEMDIQFSVRGAATVKFGGSPAPDQFAVNSVYDTVTDYNGRKSGRSIGVHGDAYGRSTMKLNEYQSGHLPGDSQYPNVRVVPYDGKLTYVNDFYGYMWVPLVYPDTPYFYATPPVGLFLYDYIAVNTGHQETSTILPVSYRPGSLDFQGLYFRFDDPLYSFSRTFGTNGRTQVISFEVSDVSSSSVVLDGRGASDNYDVDVGLGSFLNITVDDSDPTTQNTLHTNFLDGALLPHKATLTDNSVNLEFYTQSNFSPTYGVYYNYQAVKYTPTIFFGDNIDITLHSAYPFKQVVVDRPRAPQDLTVVADGVYPVIDGVQSNNGNGRTSIYSPLVAGDLSQTGTFFERYRAPPLQPLLSVSDVSVTEGDGGTTQATFTVSLSFISTNPVTVHVNTADGTATLADDDYQAVNDLVLTFQPGGTLAQTVTVLVNGDTAGEPDETFLLNLSNPSGAIIGGHGTGTILNDDAVALPTLSIDGVSHAEGNNGTTQFVFTVMLSFDPTAPVTVMVNTADGTATLTDGDYQTISNLVLTFQPGGLLTQTVTVLVSGDTKVEPDEDFAVVLSAATGATIAGGQGNGTILNDDIPITPSQGPQDIIVLGADAGARPRVTVIDAHDHSIIASFLAYDSGFRGGVRVAVGDLDGDGDAEIIVAPGAGLSSLIKVFDLDGHELVDFRTKAYLGFRGGVFVAVADVNGDGRPDLITSPGSGLRAMIEVFKNRVGIASSNTDPISNKPIYSFRAFGKTFTGGATVAAADLTGDGKAEVIVGNGPGMGPHVRVFDLTTITTNALAPNILKIRPEIRPFDTGDRGGVFVAVGNVRGDATSEIVIGNGANGRGRVEMYDADGTRFKSVTAYNNGEGRKAPVHVATKDIDADALDEALTGQGSPGSAGQLRSFDHDGTLVDDILEGEDDFRFGFFLA
ncbi:MAG: VCBS repeat-containing protein [Pirellulales bacterium]|nr:VCBS repeat-containing protein [Pirellulales bacterium]